MPVIVTEGPVRREDVEALVASAETGVKSAEAMLRAARELLTEFDAAAEAGGIVFAGNEADFDPAAIAANYPTR